MAKASRHTKPAEQGRCRRTQPADNPPGTGLKATQQPADGRPRSKTTAADDVGRPLAVQCRLVEGLRWCWPLKRRARTYLPVSLPPIAFACHCTYPLPKFVKPNLAPTYFFCFYFYFTPFTSPFKLRPLTPFTVCVRLTYGALAYSHPLRSLPGGE